MKRIFIVGGDGFARECYQLLSIQPHFNKDFTFGGFLGHGGYGTSVDYKSVRDLYICEVSEYNFHDNDYVIIGAAYPKIRSKIYNELKERNIKFFNFITADSFINPSAKIGECNILVSTVITSDVIIGNGNVFNLQNIVGHDAVIGDLNFFGPRSQVLGYAQIKDKNQFGVGSAILAKAKIGSDNIISPMSVVYKGCKDGKYLHGNPALNIGNI